MRIDSARFGPLDVDEASVFTFPMGLLGFARQKRFVVLDHAEDSPFKWLQSCDDPQLAFIITDPLFFHRAYHVSVRRADLGVIEAERVEDLVLSVIMTVPANAQDMSANLLAPLIFNMRNRLGMQHVLSEHHFPVKFYVLRDGDAARATAGEPVPPASEEPNSISLR